MAFNQFHWLQELNVRSWIQSEGIIRYSIRRLLQDVYNETAFLPVNISAHDMSPANFAILFNSWKYSAFSPEVLAGFFCTDANFEKIWLWQRNDFVPAAAVSGASDADADARADLNSDTALFVRAMQEIKKHGLPLSLPPRPIPRKADAENAPPLPVRFFSDFENLYVVSHPSFYAAGASSATVAHAASAEPAFCVFVFDRAKIKTELLPAVAAEIFGDDFKYNIGIFDDRRGMLLYSNTAVDRTVDPSCRRIPIAEFFAHGHSHSPKPPMPALFDFIPAGIRNGVFSNMEQDSFERRRREFFSQIFPEIVVVPNISEETLRAKYIAGTVRNIFITLGIFSLILFLFFTLIRAQMRTKNLAARQQEFIATISHELKTPIAVISSAAQNLTAGIIKEPERISEYGELIKNEADRLALSVSHYLLYAGTTSAAQEQVSKEICSVRDVLRSVIKSAEAERARAGFEFDVRLPGQNAPKGALLVAGNSVSLDSAFSNLVLNAMRHAAAGKYLGISAWYQQDFPVVPAKIVRKPAQSVKKSAENGFVCVSFSDKGNGIDDRELKTIFEPFVRGKDALKNQIPGNGIGLSLVAKVVAVHKGFLYIDTKKFGGTVFTIVLPAADSSEENHHVAENFNA